jgi:uncharacterized protein
MKGYIPRRLGATLEQHLRSFPAVALLGPRQCGKTTLASETIRRWPSAVYLDLERPSDLRKLADAELYFETQRARLGEVLFCLDEIQRTPDLFPLLRSLIDAGGRNGQFLLLGSASRDLIRQTSESLAGRIVFLELTPLRASEVETGDLQALSRYWLRGGFPRSLLAASDAASYAWRQSFVRSFLERDIPQLGFSLPAESLRRLWRMLAHEHGRTLNSSRLGASLGVSHTTVRSYVDLLVHTFMVRLLEPLEANVKKRLVKSPRVYVRDTGLLHGLLEIPDQDELLGHPAFGASWEGLVIDNVIAALPGWRPSFYRTSAGAEVDLVLSRGRRRLAVECKASAAPDVSRGFWSALADASVDEAWVIAPVKEPYPLRDGVWVSPLAHFLSERGEERASPG